MDSSVIQILERLLRPLRSRINSLILVGLFNNKEQNGEIQASFSPDDVQGGIRCVETFGFTSHPERGSKGYFLFPGGSRFNGLYIGTGPAKGSKFKLEPGDSAHYSEKGFLIVRKSGAIEISNGTDELISILIELVGQLKSVPARPMAQADMSVAVAYTVNPVPSVSLDAIEKKLKGFQSGK